MKSTTLLALFLLCALTPSYLPSATAGAVFDTDGDPLGHRWQHEYFILPVTRGSGGGIAVAATGNERCPVTVVQSHIERDKGFPVTFETLFHLPFIAEGLPLKISFGNFEEVYVPRCYPSFGHSWAIVDGLAEGPAVKVEDRNIDHGWFKIEKAYPLGYKLLYCRLSLEETSCGDIGIYTDDKGFRRLVVTKNKTLVVQFQKFGPLAKNNRVLPRSQ